VNAVQANRTNFLAKSFVTPINKLCVRDWMTSELYTLASDSTLQEAAEILLSHQIDGVPVIDAQRKVIGLITKTHLIRCFTDRVSPDTKIMNIISGSVKTIGWKESLEKAYLIPVGRLPVVDETGKLVGILTRTDILRAYSSNLARLPETIYSAEVFKTVIESAYEGIVVVDREGIVREFNEAYCKFIGKRKEEVINKHVSEVIENTRLHIAVKTGIPERGFVQRIQGQDIVVHRIPIWKNGEVVGAIGMLIFEGVTELYNILDRMQSLSRKAMEKGVPPERSREIESRPSGNKFDTIIGKSENMIAIKHLARRAAVTHSTILITGESGTGKEVFAKAIHSASTYADGPFIGINCAAIPEHLLESELFGYEDGAFTGARKGGKPGKFELANKGTLFLDEIGDMPMLMQSKMLRVLQEREVERVGGVSGKHVDVRIIAATNATLEEKVKQGTFREDLYYRLNVIRIHIPALRERKSDIPILLSHLLQDFCRRFGLMPKQFTPEVTNLLIQYEWPGNIRELVNTVEMTVSLADGLEITTRDLPLRFLQEQPVEEVAKPLVVGAPLAATQPHFPIDHILDLDLPHVPNKQGLLSEAMRQVLDREKELLLHTLAEVKGNKSAAAKKLNIHRSTLYEKLKNHGLT
jgi:PAS domain S-box-containing protein